MTPEQRTIWDRMPEPDRERARNAAAFVPLGSLVELWASAQEYQAALDRGDARAAHAERERSHTVTEAEQDALDQALVDRCLRGEYGTECKETVESVPMPAYGVSKRAWLREVRRAVVAVRHGGRGYRRAAE